MEKFTNRRVNIQMSVGSNLRFMKLWACLLLVLFTFSYSFSQLAVTQNANATALSQMLAGSGVTISNVTKTCNTLASGTFTNSLSNLGLTQGVVLSTGKVSSIPQSANSFSSTALTGSGDPQLSTLTLGTIYDPCILEFDVVPQGDTLQFKYVFASEEYPEFVCSQFNDVFGFFITGPNPAGGAFTNKNIALIPNSTMPVCINSVNGGISGTYNGTTWNSNGCISLSNTIDYVNNTAPVSPYIVYNGMTKVLNALASVVPCQTYHLKIALADVGDRFYDSGVFLEAYSFSSTPYTVAITSKINDTAYAAAYEGCMGGTFTVSISAPQTSPVTIALNISGTATNGVDYNTIPASVVIPAGQTSVTIPLTAIQDSITEPAETVTLAVLNQCSGTSITSATITIMDDPTRSLTVADSTLCAGQSAQLNATGGNSYSWSPAVGLSSTNISNPIATPAITSTYTANITLGSCVYQLSQTIHVSNPTASIAVSPSDTVCPGATVQLTASAANGVSPYSYLWSNGNVTNQAGATTSGSYVVTVTDAYLCTAKATNVVTISTPLINNTTIGPTCASPNSGSINLNVSGGIPAFTYLWSDGVTSQNRGALAVGVYSVTVTDAKGCTASQSINLSQANGGSICNIAVPSFTADLTGTPDSIWISPAVVRNSQCCTASFPDVCVSFDITLDPSALGIVFGIYSGAVPSGSLYYQIDCGPFTPVGAPICLTGPCDHHLTFCKPGSNTNQYIISSLKKVTVTTNVTDPTCSYSTNGSISLNVLGGYPPYSFKWSDGSTVQNRTNLAPGTYTVTVSDTTSCFTSTATATVNVIQPAPIIAAASPSNVSCSGGNNGAISLNVTNGTAPYSFNWAGGIASQNRNNLVGGNYNVTVTDSKGCSASTSATITQPLSILAATVTTVNVNCNGGSNGSINLSVSGGTTPYSYNWGGGIATQNRSNLVSGTYSVTITDANGCSVTTSAAITQPAVSLRATATPNGVSCFGGHNGTIGLTAAGGTAPYYYLWNDGATIPNIANLAIGNYSVTVTDAKGCSVTTSAAISQPTSALSTSAITSNASCFGSNNGSINLTTTGGTPAYTYNWTGGITTQNRINLISGTYNVTVTDSKGCSVTLAATVTQPVAALSANAAATNVNCFAGNNGSIVLTVTGGTTPYAYNWGGGVVTQNRNNLVAGTYGVTVTDTNGCSVTTSSAITQPATALGVVPTANAVSCFGGNNGLITTSVTGGTTPYSYLWSNASTASNISSLVAGTFALTVTDAKGCSVTASSAITQPISALSTSAVTSNASCFGSNNGSINLTTTGGTPAYTYNWTGGITTQNRINLISGTYNVTVTDSKGCSVTLAATVTQPVAALSANAAATNVNCFAGNNGSIVLTVTGGTTPYAYNWGGGAVTQNHSNLVAGTYNVTVTDANGCSVTASSAITQPAAALSVVPTANAVSCFGGNNGLITTSVTGGTTPYSYLWSNASTASNISSLVAGTFALTVTDAKGCSVTASSDISQPASALSTSAITSNASCFGSNSGSINLTTTGGTPAYTYNWTGGITTQNRINLISGTYNVTVTDSKGCSVTLAATVTQPVAALSANAAATNVNCFAGNNGSIVLTVTGGTTPYAYNWGGGVVTQNRNNLAAGTYGVTVTDANGCSVTASPIVSQPVAALNVTISNLSPVLCYGAATGGINLTVSGGSVPYSFIWSNGATSQSLANASAATYSVSVSDANGCSSLANGIITQPASALNLSLLPASVSCFAGNNGAITSNAGGGTSPYSFHWNNGNASQNLNNLTAGNYQLTITDANGCSLANSASVSQPTSALNVTANSNQVACYGGNNGSIQLAVQGGTASYAYNWNDGAITANRNALLAGNYSVTVYDANGCTAIAAALVKQPSNALSATAVSNNVKCFGNSSGSALLHAAGGTSPYSYNWGNGIVTANRGNLSSGIYPATVTDANGCSVLVTDTITQPAAAVNASLTSNSIACYGDADGDISVTVTGGVIPYNYHWSDGLNTPNRSGLAPGSYAVTITDANACSATITGNITQPAQALRVAASVTNVSCNTGNNGAIGLNVTGGTPPYSYKWDGGNTNQNRTQLSAGNYQVTVYDANGCQVVKPNVVTEPAALAVSLHATDVSCFNGNNGAISLSVTGGTPAYSYNWGNGVVTQNRSQLIAGNYAVTLTDAHSCSVTAAAIVNQPASAISISPTVNNVTCFSGNNGTIQLSVLGGSAPYSFNWSGGGATPGRTGLSAGSYTVSVSDNHGCVSVVSATVTQPASGLNASANVVNVNCFNGNNGAINLSVAGGTQPYSFSWNTGQRSENITALIAGNYTVSVSDVNGCSLQSSSSVTQPAALSTSISAHNVGCFGGANGVVSLSVNGGTQPYFYSWSNGAVTQNVSNLSSGVYDVTVTDSKSCTITAVSAVSQPLAAISVSISASEVSCFGGNNGSLTLHVTGGTSPYAYNWGLGLVTQNRTGLSAGSYAVTITDADLCSATSTAAITQPASRVAVTAIVNNVSCANGNNGSINLNVTGGSFPYTFTWSGGATTQNRTGLSAGNYVVTITDSKGCTATANEAVTQPQHALAVTATVASEVSCYNGNNGIIDLNVTGGTTPYQYNWTGGVTTENRNNLVAGSYQVTVTDNHGCTAVANGTITQPGSALAITPHVTNINCYGGSNGAINISAAGGTAPYNYNWGSGITSQNRSGLTTGNYVVTVTDNKGCVASVSSTVTQVSSAVVLSETVSSPGCFGGDNGAIKLNVSGGVAPYNFNWNGGVTTQNRNNIIAGSYSVTVTDANGCTMVASVHVTAPDSISLKITEVSPLCFGAQNGRIQVTAAGGTPGYRFVWNTGSGASQLADAGAGNYAVTVTDLNGCTADLIGIVLTQPIQIALSVNVINGACTGADNGKLAAIAAGGTSPYQYLWSNGRGTYNVGQLGPGSYAVTVTDANQCSGSATAIVKSLPRVDGVGATNPLPCQNAKGDILLTMTNGGQPYSFKWSDGATTQNLSDVHPGTYNVTVQDANGCSFDTAFVIGNLNEFSVQASGGGTIKLGGNSDVHVTGTGSGLTVYNWTPASSLSCSSCQNALAQPVETTTYTVVGTDTNGCVASDTVSVIVIEDHTIFTPNAFTPNGDGNNDYFQIFGNLAGIHSIEIKIFNRWGEKVFESEDPNFKWDGTYKGILQMPEVFAYEMKIVFLDGRSDELKKGSITLVR